MFVYQNQHLILHHTGAAYWEEEKTLLLADVHLGKATHFRKQGIAVPLAVSEANWDMLTLVFRVFSPQRVIFLGDLFHSTYNTEWEAFAEVCTRHSTIRFELVRGNHDILAVDQYAKMGLFLHEKPIEVGPFILAHEPLVDDIPEGRYGLAGHIHPGILLRGKGKQRLRLPCFYFGRKLGILPAFGAFTGLGLVEPEAGSQVFVLAEDTVVPL